jgi:hypothetical protein
MVRDVLGGNVLGTYPHGSAVLQGPGSSQLASPLLI